MQILLFSIYLIHVLVSLFLILVVLLQQGKGADLAVFGGGSTQAAFGARSATTLLHKLTVGGFIIFITTTISIAVLQDHVDKGSSIVGAAAAAAEIAADAVDETTDAASDATQEAMDDSAADPNATPGDPNAAQDTDSNTPDAAPEEGGDDS